MSYTLSVPRIRMMLLFAWTITLATGSLVLRCSSDKSLRTKVLRELDSVEGEFAVAFEDLTTGEQLLINAYDPFHAASTMKTSVMIETYKQAHEGRFSLNDSLEVKNSFTSIVDGSPFTLDIDDDSDTLIYQQIGRKRSIYSLVYDMIILSSNLATNLVIELVDAQKVTATMRTLGAKDIQVLRGVEDIKAYEKGLNNSTTAYDQMLIMKTIAQGEAVTSTASAAMLNILFDQQRRDIIPAKLPPGVRVADKRGWLTDVEHDCAIVVLPDSRRYVLVLLSRKLKDRERAVEAMATVSRVVFDHVVGEK